MNKLILAGSIGFASVLLAAPAAFAAPPPDSGTSIVLSCPSYTGPVTTARGNGDWTPAFGTGGQVFVPIAFDYGGGDVIFKPGNRNGQAGKVEECTFTATTAEGAFTGGVLVTVHGRPQAL